MKEISLFFKESKNLTNLLVLVILVLGLPVGIGLVRTQQVLLSRADTQPIVFIPAQDNNPDANNAVVTRKDGTPVVVEQSGTSTKVALQITSPLGGPASTGTATGLNTNSLQNAKASLSNKLIPQVNAFYDSGEFSSVGQFHDQCGSPPATSGRYCDGGANASCSVCGGSDCGGGPQQVCCNDPAHGQYQCYSNPSYQAPSSGDKGGGQSAPPANNGGGNNGGGNNGGGNSCSSGSTKCGSISCDSLDSQLHGANYPGPYDCRSCGSSEVNAYNNAATCTGGGTNGGGGSNLTINSCSPDKSNVNLGDTVNWVANVSGGSGTKTFSWSGDAPLGSTNASTNKVTYDSANGYGAKGATVTVTDSNNQTVSQSCGTVTVAAPAVTTVSFKISENRQDLDSQTAIPYTSDGMVYSGFSFTNSPANRLPVTKTVFVEFIPSRGSSTIRQLSIDMVPPDPVIASCNPQVAITGSGINFTLTGTNFGASTGTLAANGQNLRVNQWTDTSISAVMDSLPTGNQNNIFSVIMKRPDGEGTSPENFQCGGGVGVSLIQIKTAPACRSITSLSSSGELDGVEFDVADKASGGQANTETVSIDSSGHIQGLQTKLTAGKSYKVAIKAPNSLRKSLDFTAEPGTNLKNFTLPLGNIAPLGNVDSAINSLDYSELKSEWGSGQSTAKPGDLNGDGVVNSLDWACMRLFFGQQDDPVPTSTAANSSPSPSPSATLGGGH